MIPVLEFDHNPWKTLISNQNLRIDVIKSNSLSFYNVKNFLNCKKSKELLETNQQWI